MSAALPALVPTDLVVALKQAWRDGAPPDAAGALREFPSLLRYRSLAVDLAYEEYCLREEAGRVPDAESFCRALPAYRSAVREVIRGHRALFDHPELFDRVEVRWPEPGQEFEGFTVVRELGRGAFARAYLARDPHTGDRLVVLKLSPTPSGEGRTLGRFRHPHVAEVLWAKPVNGVAALCLRFEGAATLADVIAAAFAPAAGRPTARTVLDAIAAAGDGLPEPEPVPPLLSGRGSYADAVAAVGARLAGALARLHATDVTHGDLKPSNIVLAPGGHPFLIDFNLAGGADESLHRCVGTLPYMAPERIRLLLGPGRAESGSADRADVYSFGAVLYEALTGCLPYEPVADPDLTAVAADLLGRVSQGPPRLAARGVPGRLARLVRRCLDPDPTRRPSAAGLARELDRFARRRARRARLAAGLAVVLLAGLLVGWLVTGPGEPRTADEFVARGLVRLAEGDRSRAQDDFVTADGLRTDGRTAALIGYCRSRAADHEQAIALYTEALHRGYHNAWVHNNLAFAHIKIGVNGRPEQLDMALAHTAAALDADPWLPAALYNQAWARFERNADPSSRKVSDPRALAQLDHDLERLLERPPEGPQPYFLAARILAAPPGAPEPRLAAAVGHLRTAIALGLPVESPANDLATQSLAERPDFRHDLPPADRRAAAADPALVPPPQ